MEEERKIKVPTTGTYDFPNLILGGKGKYVDKTDLLYRLANDADQQLFISRPRRFGKSLMLSTLKAMFEGRRELFKGLAIDKLPWEGWKQPHPVLHFDMSRISPSEGRDAMKSALMGRIQMLAESFGVGPLDSESIGFAFDELLRKVSASSDDGQVVVLVDEYDFPIAGVLDDPEELRWIRFFLHDFYSRLKSNSGLIRFLMMTGVTKLAKLSVFSGINHLKDRSMDERFATLLGYTPEELDGPLRENVRVFAEKNGMDFATAKKALLAWYDGYRFSPGSEARVCNPVSLGSALESGKLESYWESTGRATLIINSIVKAGKMPSDLENVAVFPLTLDVCDAETLPMESLLYQGGYLTIKDVKPPSVDESGMPISEPTFILSPPNFEVREALKRGYLSQVMGLKEQPFNALVEEAKRYVAAGDWRKFILEALFRLYASVPPDWQIRDEAEAKRYFQLFALMCGANPLPEYPSFFGYADAVMETPSEVCVFEFKYRRSAKAAIKQIRERGYADKWIGGERPVTLVGINFNPKKRNIDIPVIEPAGA